MLPSTVTPGGASIEGQLRTLMGGPAPLLIGGWWGLRLPFKEDQLYAPLLPSCGGLAAPL